MSICYELLAVIIECNYIVHSLEVYRELKCRHNKALSYTAPDDMFCTINN